MQLNLKDSQHSKRWNWHLWKKRIIISVLVIHNDLVDVHLFLVSLISENIPNNVCFLLLFLHFRKSFFLWNIKIFVKICFMFSLTYGSKGRMHNWYSLPYIVSFNKLELHSNNQIFSLVISKCSLIMDMVLNLWEVERLPTVSREVLFWFPMGWSLTFTTRSMRTYWAVVK